MKRPDFFVVPAILAMLAGVCEAHHSFATHYDSNNVVEISGVLTSVKMRSPHSFFELDVSTANGGTERWEVEAHAVPILRRLGISNDTLRVGDTVTFRGPRSRRPEKTLLFGAEIRTARGEQFEMLDSIRRPPEETVTDTRENVSGVDRLTGKWMTFITGQRVAESPLPLNAAGVAARENFDPLRNSASDCVPSNLPSLLMIPYVYEITREGDTVTLFHEYAQISRPVVLGSTDANVTDAAYGARTGSFADDSLLVHSSDFPPMSAGLASGWEPNGNGADVPSSEQKSLVERYSVNEDGSMLTVEYTVTDPAYLTAPYTAEVKWYRMPDDAPIFEFTCDAEIASRSTSNAAVLEK